MFRHHLKRLVSGLFVLFMAVNFTFAERIHLRLLKGSGGNGLPTEGTVLHLEKASFADMNRIGKTIDWSSVRQIVQIQDFLVEFFDLESVEDIFGVSLEWDGTKSPLQDRIAALGRGVLFPYELNIIPVGLNSYEIRIIIAQAGELLEPGQTLSRNDARRLSRGSLSPYKHKIFIEDKLTVEKNELSISAVTSGEATYILALRVEPEPEPEKQDITDEQKEKLVPISTVLPAYPLEFKQKGVRGDVELKIKVDEEGYVRNAAVVKPLHPYLDYAAVQAVRQWRYEPFRVEGQIVPISAIVVIRFDPAEQSDDEREENIRAAPYPAELARILELGGDYCERLENAVLDFICIETIKETHYYLHPDMYVQPLVGDRTGNVWLGTKFIRNDPSRTEQNTYVCDYMLIRTESTPEEQRLVLKEKGGSTNVPGTFLKEDKYIAIGPLFASIRILGKDRQNLFNYRLLGKKKINGIQTSVIEALPKSGNADGVEFGKLWVDPQDGCILQSEIHGVPLKGFEDVLEETTKLNVKSDFVAVHEYEVEKNNLFFPSRSIVEVTYPSGWTAYPTWPSPKLKAVITYKQYKFFMVSTDVKIKK